MSNRALVQTNGVEALCQLAERGLSAHTQFVESFDRIMGVCARLKRPSRALAERVAGAARELVELALADASTTPFVA